MDAAPPKHNLALGIVAICAAFFLSALTGVISKFLHGVSSLIIVFFQYGVSLVLFLPFALRQGLGGLKTEHAEMQVIRSVAGAVSQLLYFWSLGTLSLLDASLLSNASPLFIPIIVWLWLKKPVQLSVWLSLAVGLVGVILVIHPGPQMFSSAGLADRARRRHLLRRRPRHHKSAREDRSAPPYSRL